MLGHFVVIPEKEMRRNIVKKIRKAVIPAAGRGLPFTGHQGPARRCFPVDKLAIQYIIEETLTRGLRIF